MSGLEIIFLSSSALTLGIGVVILLLNHRRLINQCSFLAALLSSLWLFFIFLTIGAGQKPDYQAVNHWLRMCNATAAFLPWALFLTKESILRREGSAIIVRRSLPWLFACVLLTALVFSDLFMAELPLLNEYSRGPGYVVYLVSMASLCALILLSALQGLRIKAGIAQLEIKFFAVNFCFATFAVLVIFLISTVVHFPMLRYAGALLVLISFGTTLWAVCYYRVFDAKQIVLSCTQRGTLIAVVALGSVFLVATLDDLMPLAFAVGSTAAIVGLAARMLDRQLERLFGLDSDDAILEARAEAIGVARKEADVDGLSRSFERLLVECSRSERAALLVLCDGVYTDGHTQIPANWAGLESLTREGWATPESLERRRRSGGSGDCLALLKQHQLGALLAAPRGSPAPTLMVAFGHRASVRPYTYPEIQLLLELTELMDNILTHAHVAARNAEIERMESAAMMSRGLAHDLNNLATPVSTFLLHMEGKVAPGTPEAEVLTDAKHSIQVMQEYIRESLFFSRHLAPQLQNQSSAELLAATVNAVQARARSANVQLVVASGPDVTFAGDRVLMLRLLQNLVVNGIDASPAGGRVTLAAALLDGDRIALTVADDGPGVPPEIADRIFEPYFTTKDTGNKTRGLGLGLAISLKIGALHGGTIHVGRATSGGALFTVTLPSSPPRPP
jgi:signal transduction histidine kinase